MMSRSATHADAWLRCVALLFALIAPLRALAEEPIALEWDAPAGCASAQEVRARIRKLAVTWPPAGPPLRAAATLRRAAAGGMRLTLSVRAGAAAGERIFEGQTCEFLANAAAIHLALLLNGAEPLQQSTSRAPPAAPDSASPSDVADTSQASPAAPESTATATETPAEPASTRSWRVLLQAPLASLQFGPLPRPSFGASLAAGVSIDRWRVLAEGNAWLAQSIASSEEPGVSADVGRISASLRTCRGIAWGSFELAPCVRISLEHAWARGAGSHVAPRTAQVTWFAAGLGAQARIQLFPLFRLMASADLQLETARPRISVEGSGNIAKLGLPAFILSLGTEWIL